MGFDRRATPDPNGMMSGFRLSSASKSHRQDDFYVQPGHNLLATRPRCCKTQYLGSSCVTKPRNIFNESEPHSVDTFDMFLKPSFRSLHSGAVKIRAPDPVTELGTTSSARLA